MRQLSVDRMRFSTVRVSVEIFSLNTFQRATQILPDEPQTELSTKLSRLHDLAARFVEGASVGLNITNVVYNCGDSPVKKRNAGAIS